MQRLDLLIQALLLPLCLHGKRRPPWTLGHSGHGLNHAHPCNRVLEGPLWAIAFGIQFPLLALDQHTGAIQRSVLCSDGVTIRTVHRLPVCR